MSRDGLSEMEQLDRLGDELAAAGRAARAAAVVRERPEPAFAVRLRAELLSELPAAQSAVDAAPGAFDATPLPPARPLDTRGRLVERRQGNRPFVGADRRRSWVEGFEAETLSAPCASTADGGDIADATKRWAAIKRWDATAEPAGKRRSRRGLAVVPEEAAKLGAEDAGQVAAVKPSMHWHIPTRMPSRWVAVGLAASLGVGTLLYGAGLFTTVRTVSVAADAASATLIRGGVSSPLIVGTELREGDEIQVAIGGRATLQLGNSYARLAGGADLRLKSLDAGHLDLNQITGRVYHRVVLPNGGDYRVETASVSWTAVGTAFDLDRHSTAGGGEVAQGLALYDGVDVNGPQIDATLAEGMSETVVLKPDGTPDGSPVVEPITPDMLAGDWLFFNAGLDARLGLPLGRLADLISPEPSSSAAGTPAASATAPEHKITLIGGLSDRKASLAWTRYYGDGFAYYKIVRSTDATVSWPLGSGDSAIAAISDIDKLTYLDAAPAGQTFYYAVFAVRSSDEGYAVLADSNVVKITLPAPTPPPTPNCGMGLSWSLGAVGASGAVPANTGVQVAVTLNWSKFGCTGFQEYVVLVSQTGPPDAPLPHGDSQIANYGNYGEISDVHVTSLVQWLDPGTYYFRVVAWTSSTAVGGGVYPACEGGTVLSRTNYVKVVVG